MWKCRPIFMQNHTIIMTTRSGTGILIPGGLAGRGTGRPRHRAVHPTGRRRRDRAEATGRAVAVRRYGPGRLAVDHPAAGPEAAVAAGRRDREANVLHDRAAANGRPDRAGKEMESIMKTRFHLVWCVVAVVLVATTASALDFTDVKNLIKNGVAESVIINMTSQDSSLAITADQANELRLLGASESLVASIRRTLVAEPSATGGTFADGSSYVIDESAAPRTTVVQPQTVVTSPGTTTYYDPSTGTYYQSAPPVVVSPPTVVYEAPRVVTAPTYVYPAYRYPRSGWNFSFHFGGGNRYRRHGRPHRW